MKFYVIGITDAPQPFFPPEVLEIIKQGRLFSGGKRHHELVARWCLPAATPCSLALPTLSNIASPRLRLFSTRLSTPFKL